MQTSSWKYLGAFALVALAACNPPLDEADVGEPELAVLQSSLVDTCDSRNNELLTPLKTPDGGRHCLMDEDCPWGSHCNRATGMCDWQCLEGGEEGTECPDFGACDCSGRCPSTAPTGNPTVLPRMAVEPYFLQFPVPDGTTVWTPQRMRVAVRSVGLDGGVLPTTATNAVVNVEAGRDMEVACGDPSAGGTFASECALSGWSFVARNGEHRAEKSVWARPRTGVAPVLSDGGVPDWDVQLASESTSNRRLRVTASVPEAAGTAGTVREYSGVVSLAVGPGDAAPLRLPVRAWADADYLFLFDDSRTLSPTGRLRLGRAGAAKYISAWLPLPDGGAAGMTAEVEGFFEGNPLADSFVKGQFAVGLPRPVSGGGPDGGAGLSASFTLRRVEGVTPQACPSTGNCGAGFTCEPGLGGSGVCVAGHQPWAQVSASTPVNAITHAGRKAWSDDLGARLGDALAQRSWLPYQLAQGLVCNQGGTSGAPELAGFGADVLPISGDLKCANGSPPYVAAFFTQRDRYAPTGGDHPELFNSEELFNECLADLGALPTPLSAPTTDAWLTERLRATRSLKMDPLSSQKTPARCFSLVRFFGALELSALKATSRDQKLAWRLLQQWVDVHGFLAQEVVRQHDVADYIDGVAYRSDWPSLAGSMDRMERGWDLLLDGANARLMPGNDAARTCGLLNPDYRLTQKPVTTWEWQGTSVPTRGQNATWQRKDMTFVFASENAYDACPTSTSAYLTSLAYTADGVATDKRRLLAQCNVSAPGTVKWGVQTLAKVSAGTDMRVWTGGTTLTPTQRALRTVLVERDGAQRLFGSGAPTAPDSTAFSYEHFLLRTTPDGRVYGVGPTPNRAGVFDYPLSDAQVADVLARPEYYLGPQSEDMTLHPQDRAFHAQSVALPASILEGLSSHVRLLVAEMELVERETVATCTPASLGARRDQALARFGRTMRYALALESFAAAARERDMAGCLASNVELPWTARWERARAELSRVRQQAYEKVRALNECRPYGLPEDEAPLYFGAVIPSGADDATAKFFGSSSNLYSKARTELDAAIQQRSEARSAWLSLKTNQVQNVLTQNQREQRLFELKREYGRPVVDLCGFDSASSADILDMFDPVRSQQRWNKPARRPETCFVDLENPVCQLDTTALFTAVTDAQARFTLCTWNELRPFAQLPVDVDAAAVGYASAQVAACNDGNGRCVRVGGVQRLRVSELFGIPLTAAQGETMPEGIMGDARMTCSTRLGGTFPLPSAESVGTDLDKSCYRGDMGAAMLGLLASRQSLAVARSAFDDSMEKFDLANQRCAELQVDLGERNEMEEAHRSHMTELISKRSAAERDINYAEGGGDALVSAVKLGVAIYTGNVIGGIQAGVDLVVGVFKSKRKDDIRRFSAEIEVSEQAYQLQVQQWESEQTLKECFAEAKMHMVGIRTASLQVERAVTDTDAAMLALRNMERTVRQRLTEGWDVVAQEEQREIPAFTHHFWLHGEILQAKTAFSWAKRVAYLLALSLEYETQRTQGVRQSIAEAVGPDDLTAALNTLDAAHFDQTLNGKFVEKHFLVLRLRDQLLGIKDRVSVPSGERAWSGLQRMKHQLLAPERAVYDQKGNYLGQGFRFTMPELPPGFPDRCAERMWGVALYLSTENLSPWDSLNGIPLRLRKRNTFQSHLCGEDMEPTDFQTRAARPSLRLGSVGTNGVGEENMYTPADIMAFTDSSTTALDAFKEGGSLAQVSFELKGRGLYGEYELIFPWKGLLQNGFPLEKVNDAFLRFEVLSVAKD